MSLIRRGGGSQLYIYATSTGFECCGCECISDLIIHLATKEELKKHILLHKESHHTIGLVGDPLTYQSYDELLNAVDGDDF